MMDWTQPRRDFYVAQNFFEREVAQSYLAEILRLGEDPERGFHHPNLKPNRFHAHPKYPVSRYMGLGLYWNPLDYRYHTEFNGLTPFALPVWLIELSLQLAHTHFPQLSFFPETALVNYYLADKKMSWHTDKEEENKRAPVIGINFGSTCRFYFESEAGAEESFILPSNSVYVFGESARQMRHAVGSGRKNTLSPESHGLLASGERLNITVRKVRKD